MAEERKSGAGGSGDAADVSVSASAPTSLAGELRESFRNAFDGSFWIFLILSIVSGFACWFVGGPETFAATLRADIGLMIDIVPKIIAAVAIAGLVQVLIPRQKVARVLGEESGAKGLVLAAGAGALTPGGPMTSFPLVSALQAAGGGRATLVSYVTSWSVLGLQRILTWELPLLGADFVVIRTIASLPLPFIAAGIAKLVPRHPDDSGR
jgi:uncharacterized membrane protein YraQ (UPF0718 family)